MMPIIKDRVPTATVHQHRIRLFQPTRRPIYLKDVMVETEWGTIKITGKLGQAHADVLEAIMFCGQKPKVMEDGRIKLLVDPFRVQKIARQSCRKQLSVLLDDLMAAVVHVNIEEDPDIKRGHLIDDVREAKTQAGVKITKANPFGGERGMWRVDVGRALTDIIKADIWVSYDPQPIAALRHGISQAIVRHVLTHKNQPRGGWFADTLINAVCGSLPSQQLRDRRRELRADGIAMKKNGISIEGDRVFRVE